MSAPPMTIVSFVRHTHVPSVSGAEHTPGLSHHDRHDAARVTARLADLADVVATSPVERAHAAVKSVADAADTPLVVDDDLRERELADSPIKDFDEAVEYPWVSPNTSHPGDESHAEMQARGIAAVDRLVGACPDHRVAVGTRATLMTLVFNAYDPRYGREFWTGLATLDMYEMTFVGSEVFGIIRMRTPEEAARKSDADRDPVKH